jgi:hypothetical protein
MLEAAIANCGADPWPNNDLRQSFISCHFAMYQDLAATATQAGQIRKDQDQTY